MSYDRKTAMIDTKLLILCKISIYNVGQSNRTRRICISFSKLVWNSRYKWEEVMSHTHTHMMEVIPPSRASESTLRSNSAEEDDNISYSLTTRRDVDWTYRTDRVHLYSGSMQLLSDRCVRSTGCKVAQEYIFSDTNWGTIHKYKPDQPKWDEVPVRCHSTYSIIPIA